MTLADLSVRPQPLNFVSGSEQSRVLPAIKPKSDLKMRSKEIYIYIIYTGYTDTSSGIVLVV